MPLHGLKSNVGDPGILISHLIWGYRIKKDARQRKFAELWTR